MLIRSTTIVFILGLAAAAGCGDDDVPPGDGDAGTTAGFELSAAPELLTLLPGTEETVAVTIVRDADLEGAVHLAAVGVPAGLEVTFPDPGPTGGEGSAVVRAMPDAEPGLEVLWIRGESDRGRSAVAVGVEVVDTTVAGTVVDLLGQPVSDATVAVGDEVQVTVADGRFEVPGVVPPYDVVVVRAGPAGSEAHRWVGLERMDPQLYLVNLIAPQPRVATVTGVLDGGASFPNPDDTVAFVVVSTGTGGKGALVPQGGGPIYGPINVPWTGEESVPATVHALQWRLDGAGLPIEYTGYTSRDVTLVHGESLTENMTLESVETTFVTAEPSAPDGHTLASATVHLRFGDGVSIPLAIDRALDDSATYAVPREPSTLGLQVNAEVGEATTAVYLADLSPGAVVAADVPPAPRATTPPEGDSAVSATTAFEWTAYEEAVYVLTAVTTGGPSFAIYTDRPSATFGGFDPPGVSLAPGATYLWRVEAIGPYESVDGYVGPGGGVPFFGAARDARLGRTEVRSFTAAP